MGLIKAALGATLGTLADQWKEYFTCDSIDNDTLMVKGQKVISGRSSNTSGSDNLISQGSGIVVADGQCAIIVDQGIVREVVAEPGMFTYDASSEPTLFYGPLNKDKIKSVIGTAWERFKMGGVTGKDQRVYYFNVKEIIDNKFGTATPIPFRVVDRNVNNLDLDVSLRCNGMFTFRLTDPVSFYKKLGGNVSDSYETETLLPTLKQEFISGLQPALGKLSDLAIRPYAIPQHVDELCKFMNDVLNEKWSERGISIVSIAINSVTLPEEDAKMLRDIQKAAIMRDPTMAAAQLTAGQIDAMKTAAGNSNGAMSGFMGMGFAQGAGGMNAGNLFAMGQQQQAAQQQMAQQQPQNPAPAQAAGGWKCSCGTTNTGKFCTNCGQKKPEAPASWTCSCGSVNTGKFCTNCGQKRPEAPANWTCSCGTTNTGKFCTNCGQKRPE